MGQDISLPVVSSIPNSTTIYNKTQPTIDIMNKVLDFILKNADYRDMIALANEKECSKWIIIAENKLLELFQKIKLQPELKDGVLYLKKVDELKQNNDISGCKLLAAFFIRLFQVVGALSLSIMDTKIPDRADYLITAESKQTERKGVPFFSGTQEQKKKRFFGGELEQELIEKISPKISIFRRYLTPTGKNTYFLTSIAKSREAAFNIPGYSISIKDDKLIFVSTLGGSTIKFDLIIKESELLVDVFERNGKEYPYTESFTYSPQKDETIKVRFLDTREPIDFADFITSVRNKIAQLPASQTVKILNELGYLENSRVQQYYKKIKDIKFGSEENSGIFVKETDYKSEDPRFDFGYPIKKDNIQFNLVVSFTLLITKTVQNEEDTYTVEITKLRNDSSSKSLEFEPSFDFENEKEEELDPKLQTADKTTRKFTVKTGFDSFTKEPTNRRQTIPKYLQNMFEIIKNQALSTLDTGAIKSKQGYLNPIDDSSIKNTRLKTRELWTNLIRTPPVKSFCTARALQLLNISGLQKIIPEKIRPLIFNTSFDLVKDGSLPTPGKPITTSIGIKALQSLYDDFSSIYKGETYDPKIKTKNFSLGKIVLESFIENEELRKNIETLDGIIENSSEKVDPFESKTDRLKVSRLREQARLLFQKQFEHTVKVNKLLQKLFIFSDPITLNPSILAKGIKGVEEIAAEARNLLTEYYSQCQVEYSKGVRILTNRQVSISPNPAPSKA